MKKVNWLIRDKIGVMHNYNEQYMDITSITDAVHFSLIQKIVEIIRNERSMA